MNNKIGERINTALALRNIKQKELAKELGIKDNIVSYWCSGSRTPNTQQITEIAKFLNVSSDYLLGLTDTATTDMKLKSVCDYTGLEEKSVKLLYYFNEHITRFINDMVYFAKENESTLMSFDCLKQFLLSLYNRLNDDDKKSGYYLWKQNELLFTNSQFKIQSAFNKYINDDKMTEAAKFYDAVETEYLRIQEITTKELDMIDEIAIQQGYHCWCDWLQANKNKFEHPVILQEWLLKYNISISDDTANYIMASLI